MQEFMQRFGGMIVATLRGFDRLRFRGTLRLLCNSGGMLSWLNQNGVDLGEFDGFCKDATARLLDASLRRMTAAGRPVEHVRSSAVSKEEIALRIARRDGITSGPVCALTCVEPCLSYSVRRSRDRKNHVLDYCQRKCLHVYHYAVDPTVGWMNVRLQTWAPFQMKVCINGRRWLALRMDRLGLEYVQADNCFVQLSDPERAQRLMDKQLSTDWPKLLDRFVRQANPAYRRVFAKAPVDYYWTADESEWATDFIFRDRRELAGLYPRLLRHAMVSLGSEEVMRFLGRKALNFQGEVATDLRRRSEGVRVKSRCGANSVKMYDKQGRILRIETTINDPKPFTVYRRPEGRPRAKMAWRPLRKGIADLARRAEVSERSNLAYVKALSSADTAATVEELTAPLCRPASRRGRRVRALRPLDPDDTALLAAVGRAEFGISGLRNRDIRRALYGPDSKDAAENKRRSAAVSRKLALLQAHGVIRKIARTHRYTVTDKGRNAITAILAAKSATPATLNAAA